MTIAQAVIEKGMLDGMLMSLSLFTREAIATFQENPLVVFLVVMIVALLLFRARK